MEEVVGECTLCRKHVFCENGFLNGYILDGLLLCLSCYKSTKQRETL